MKKTLIILSIVAVLALSITGFAFAQSPTQTPQVCPNCTGGLGSGMGWRGNGPRGPQTDGTYGPLHDEMVSAISKALGLTPEAFTSRRTAGETAWEIAQSQGKTIEEFQTLMLQARSDALQQAVAEGTITQEQADWMLQRMNRMQANGYGPGSGNCTGTGPQGQGMRGMRWNTQP